MNIVRAASFSLVSSLRVCTHPYGCIIKSWLRPKVARRHPVSCVQRLISNDHSNCKALTCLSLSAFASFVVPFPSALPLPVASAVPAPARTSTNRSMALCVPRVAADAMNCAAVARSPRSCEPARSIILERKMWLLCCGFPCLCFKKIRFCGFFESPASFWASQHRSHVLFIHPLFNSMPLVSCAPLLSAATPPKSL